MEMPESAITWEKEYEKALGRAINERKPVLLDFYKDGCGGCAKMGTVTYPDLSTSTMVNEYFVPVQIDVSKSAGFVERFGVIWTPNIHILTGDEKMIYHVEGWLPPHDFLAMLTLAYGHFFLKNKKFKEASSSFDELLKRMPRSHFAPEALYYSGVAKYLESDDLEKLKKDWMKLRHFYPNSTWTTSSDIF
jgi:thioredoxin-related protein